MSHIAAFSLPQAPPAPAWQTPPPPPALGPMPAPMPLAPPPPPPFMPLGQAAPMPPSAMGFQPRPVDFNQLRTQKKTGWEQLEAVAGIGIVAPITTILGGALGYMIAGPAGAAKGAVLGSGVPSAFFAIKEVVQFATALKNNEPNAKLDLKLMTGVWVAPLGASVGAWVGGLLGGPIGAGIGAAAVMSAPALYVLARTTWDRIQNRTNTLPGVG